MNILFFTASYLPTVNGVSYHINILKKHLEKRDHKVYVVAPKYHGYNDIEPGVIRYFSVTNPKIPSYPIGIPLVLNNELKKLHIDIVHTHHPFLVGSVAAIVAKKLKVPLFFTAHTRYEEYLNYYFPKINKISIIKETFNKSLKDLSDKCYKVICPSITAEEILKKNNVKNTVLIYNGVETNYYVPSDNKPTGKKILFVGRIEKEKNVEFLVKAMQILKGLDEKITLEIIGDGSYLAKVNELIKKENLTKNIIFVGNKNRNDLLNYYQSADLFVTSSLTEIMPLTIIESLSCGLPIVALKKAKLDTLVIQNKTGILTNNSHKDFAEAVFNLLNNEMKRREMEKQCRIHSLNFSIEKTTQKLLNLYSESIQA